ncbi:MAG: ribonuclease HI [Phycisphaerales bacterium]|nr:ribonuclease HI [Phycisphaerales bacterium]
MSENVEVVLFTDGACSGNPGPGGWAYILRHLATGKEKRGSGGESNTTNNRMELSAVIEGLAALTRRTRVRVVTDSQYVCLGMQEWVAGWIRNNWRRGAKGKTQPVKNVELWQALVAACEKHDVEFEHVRGHAGHPENEECDQMAVDAARRAANGEL